MFFNPTPPTPDNDSPWKPQLDDFVRSHHRELAALSWGLWLEHGNSQGTIGINLKPEPHFVYCPRSAVEALNEQVGDRLREILGIVDNHQAEQEVLMIAIGDDQIKLVHFAPNPNPPTCYTELGQDVNSLIDQLQAIMKTKITCEK
jgi:hypothetical protein